MPVPVWAWPTTSCPARTSGMTASWIGVGDAYPMSSKALDTGSDTCRLPNGLSGEGVCSEVSVVRVLRRRRGRRCSDEALTSPSGFPRPSAGTEAPCPILTSEATLSDGVGAGGLAALAGGDSASKVTGATWAGVGSGGTGAAVLLETWVPRLLNSATSFRVIVSSMWKTCSGVN